MESDHSYFNGNRGQAEQGENASANTEKKYWLFNLEPKV